MVRRTRKGHLGAFLASTDPPILISELPYGDYRRLSKGMRHGVVRSVQKGKATTTTMKTDRDEAGGEEKGNGDSGDSGGGGGGDDEIVAKAAAAAAAAATTTTTTTTIANPNPNPKEDFPGIDSELKRVEIRLVVGGPPTRSARDGGAGSGVVSVAGVTGEGERHNPHPPPGPGKRSWEGDVEYEYQQARLPVRIYIMYIVMYIG
jgi:hypothetical protein